MCYEFTVAFDKNSVDSQCSLTYVSTSRYTAV